MKTNFFIPKKINVGFRNREDTYTQKLAYVIYFDEKGKLRKEVSWNGWRDKKIENQIHENEPTSGFVLNKKAGGYDTGWNHRQTYVRVYDPRGFEFEITVPNLLYILENATSTKGKGLEGDFVYGWDGKDLVLIPVDSPDFQELVKLNKLRHSKDFIKAKDLKIGATYLTKDNQEISYIGKFDEYDYYGKKAKTKSFYFYYNKGGHFTTMKSVSQKLISVVSDDCIENYANVVDELETKTMYSPIDETKDEYIPYTIEEILEKLKDRNYMYVYTDFEGSLERNEITTYNDKPMYYKTETVTYKNAWNNTQKQHRMKKEAKNIEEIFEIMQPRWKRVYLANGKIYSEGK